MNPEFFQSPQQISNIDLWKSILGFSIVLFATFVGVEIRLGKDEEEK